VFFLAGIAGWRWHRVRWLSPPVLVLVGVSAFAGALIVQTADGERDSNLQDASGDSVATSTPTAIAPPAGSTRQPPTVARSGVKLGFANYFDLDTFRSASRPSKHKEFRVDGSSLEFNDGNSDDDSLALLFRTRVVTVTRRDANFTGCDRGTELEVNSPAYVGNLEDNQRLCMRTDMGRWAVLNETEGAELDPYGVTLDIALYERPRK
jgi:hypothetical protein